MTSPVFFTGNNQPVDMMGLVQRHSGGQFISYRRSPLIAHQKRFPDLERLLHSRLFMGLDRATRRLKNANAIVLGTLGGVWREVKNYPAKKATLFHGTFRMLSPGLVADHRELDHLFLNGPRQVRILKYALSQVNTKVKFTWSTPGYIPFDEFPSTDTRKKSAFLQQIGLSPTLPVVTYLPARRNRGSFLRHALPLAQQLHDVNLIIRPHPNQLKMNGHDEQAYFTMLKQYVTKQPTCYLDGDNGHYQRAIPELLSISDLLISDATSPTEEALFYDIPQLITETYPRERYAEEYRGTGMAENAITDLMKLYDCGVSFERSNFDHWGKAVEYMLHHPDKHRQARQDYFHDAFGHVDQQAAKRVANELALL